MTINFFPSYVIANEGCYYWGWYPACDLQIYLIMPLIVYASLQVKSAASRALIVILGTLAGILINAYIIWKNNMAAGLFAPQDVYIFKIFVNKPYTKLHALFLGLGMGLLFLSIQRSKLVRNQQQASFWKKLKHSKALSILIWITSLATIGFTTLYPLPANKNPVKWSRLHNTLFIALSRPAFLVALMGAMTCMLVRQGNIVRQMFQFHFWTPLARLSYTTYLVFPIVNATLISSFTSALFLSYYTMFYLLAFNFVFCLLLAFFVHIFFEAPMQNLMFNKRTYSREQVDNKTQSGYLKADKIIDF